MTYKHVRETNDEVIGDKARCTLCGDTTHLDIHYDPKQTIAFRGLKSLIRITFAVAALKANHMRHLDIIPALTNKLQEHQKNIVRQIPL